MAGGFWFFQPSWIVGDSFFFLKKCFQFPNLVLKSIWSCAKDVFMKVLVPGLEQLSPFLVFGEEKCVMLLRKKSGPRDWEVEVFSGFSVLSFPSSVWKEYLSLVRQGKAERSCPIPSFVMHCSFCKGSIHKGILLMKNCFLLKDCSSWCCNVCPKDEASFLMVERSCPSSCISL